MAGLYNTFLNAVIFLKLLLVKQFWWKPFIRQTHDPQATQNKLLQQILSKNRNTAFGKEYGFENISSYHEYCAAVPIQSYEHLRPYIEKQEREKTSVLNSEQPIIYAKTSGTTGKPKYIPFLKSSVNHYLKSQALIVFAQYQHLPAIYHGKVLAIVSPVIEGHLDTGTPYGSMSGGIHSAMPDLVKHKYVVPPEVFEIEDYNLKYLLIAAFALAEPGITMCASANPSTFLKLQEVIQNHADSLVAFISTGDTQALGDIPDNVKTLLHKHFHPDPERADELKTLITRPEAPYFGLFWPDLKAIVTWTGGNCGILLPRLKKLLSEGTYIVEMGYLSSEFRGSITVDIENNLCVPTFHENFYEFIERSDWENGVKNTLTLEQVELGKEYYLIVTTQNGLYRYFINDIIKITGTYHQTPTLAFVQKGKSVTNLTGEKLYESQVIDAVEKAFNSNPEFYLMLACPEALQYTLYVETGPVVHTSTDQLEKQLATVNVEFDAKRKSGRLQPTIIVPLKPGTKEAYKQHCINNGQREAQFKQVHLQYAKDCSFDFTPYQYK